MWMFKHGHQSQDGEVITPNYTLGRAVEIRE